MSATTTTRRERKLQTRAALVEAARSCFAELGYEATAIADIARSAGVATGTFYVHFTSKEEVVDEMLGAFNDDFAKRLEPVLLAAASGEEALEGVVRRAAETMIDHWRKNRPLIELYVQRASSTGAIESLRDGVNPPMAALLRRALERAAGDNRQIHAELVTQGLLGMWLRIGLQCLFHRKVSRKDAVDTLVRLTVGATSAVLASTEAQEASL